MKLTVSNAGVRSVDKKGSFDEFLKAANFFDEPIANLNFYSSFVQSKMAKQNGVQPSQFLGYLVAKNPEKYGPLAKLEDIIDGKG